MKDEVKFSNFAETGQHVNAVDINTFIRLFVNHRPVYGIGKNNIEAATRVGAAIAERAKKAGIEECYFDRGGFLFHGKVKALAEAAREGGLKF